MNTPHPAVTAPQPPGLSRLYYGLRHMLHRRRSLLRASQVVRAFLILGPMGRLAWLRQRYVRDTAPADPDSTSMFPAAPTVDDVVNQLRTNGFARLGELTEDAIQQIVEFCDETKRTRYWNPHKECGALDRLSRNTLLLDAARRYLGVEPSLWLTQLKWTLPCPQELGLNPANYKEAVQYDAHAYHYDVLDCRSLTLFVYLTDVGDDCGPHVVVPGTHRRKTLRDIARITVDDDLVTRRFGDRITTIVGKKGTAFVEDTTCLHKVASGRRNRLILSIDYVVSRTPPPDRPAMSH